MGAKQQTYATIRRALELIADRRLATATSVAKPDQYRARILDELRATKHDEALRILEEHPGTDAEILARLLDPPAPKAEPEPPNPSSHLPQVSDSWPKSDPDGLDAAAAKIRIAAIRGDLGPAHHPDRTTTSPDWRSIALVLAEHAHRCDALDFLTDEQRALLEQQEDR